MAERKSSGTTKEVETEEQAPEKKKSSVTLFNPGTSAITYSDDGRSIGGGESVEVSEVDATGQHAMDHGYLVRK